MEKHENTKRTLKRTILFVLVLLMTFCLTACQESDESKYKVAQSLMAKEKYTEAAEKFDELGSYEEASKLSMYCKAAAAGENGDYDTAFSTFSLLGDYKESQLMLVYYNARQLEANGRDNEKGPRSDILDAAQKYDTIALFRDSKERAESCRKTVYVWAEDYAEKENYYFAVNYMKALGDYGNSALMVKYYTSCQLEAYGSYREAADGFIELGDFKDSQARAENALQKGYEAAEALESNGKMEQASRLFISLGKYKDAIERGGKPVYEQAEKLFEEGDYLQAARLFAKVYSYKDALKRSWNIRYKYLKEDQVYVDARGFFYIGENGQVGHISEQNLEKQYKLEEEEALKQMEPAVALKNSGSELKPNGTVAFLSEKVSQRQAASFTDIVQYDCSSGLYMGLKSNGTVVAFTIDGKNKYICDYTSSWSGIVKVLCGETSYSSPIVYGLRYDGTVYKGKEIICNNAVDITFVKQGTGGGDLFCLFSDGSIRCANEHDSKYHDGKKWIADWKDIIYINSIEEGLYGLTRSEERLFSADYHKIELLPETTNIAGQVEPYSIIFATTQNGEIYVASDSLNLYNKSEVSTLTKIGIDSELQ